MALKKYCKKFKKISQFQKVMFLNNFIYIFYIYTYIHIILYIYISIKNQYFEKKTNLEKMLKVEFSKLS